MWKLGIPRKGIHKRNFPCSTHPNTVPLRNLIEKNTLCDIWWFFKCGFSTYVWIGKRRTSLNSTYVPGRKGWWITGTFYTKTIDLPHRRHETKRETTREQNLHQTSKKRQLKTQVIIVRNVYAVSNKKVPVLSSWQESACLNRVVMPGWNHSWTAARKLRSDWWGGWGIRHMLKRWS